MIVTGGLGGQTFVCPSVTRSYRPGGFIHYPGDRPLPGALGEWVRESRTVREGFVPGVDPGVKNKVAGGVRNRADSHGWVPGHQLRRTQKLRLGGFAD